MEFEICLNDLVFYSYHGVFEEERKNGNEFHVWLKVTLPYKDGIESDDLNATVSYADLYKIVAWEMQQPRNLLERVASGIVKRIRERYPKITGGSVKIEKRRPPIPGMIGTASVSLKF